jgi:hypothetical protein
LQHLGIVAPDQEIGKNQTNRGLSFSKVTILGAQNGGKRKMNRKIIIKSYDFNKEIFSFLKEVGADMPIDWNIEDLDQIKNIVIETFGKKGVALEIDDRLQSIPSSHLTKREDGIGMHR